MTTGVIVNFRVFVYIRFIRNYNIGRQTAARIHEQKA